MSKKPQTTFLWLKRIIKFIPLYYKARRNKTCLNLSSCWIIAKWNAKEITVSVTVSTFV